MYVGVGVGVGVSVWVSGSWARGMFSVVIICMMIFLFIL